MFFTMSSEERSGTPLLSSVARVRLKRAMAICRMRLSKSGAVRI